ncbi:MAG: tetratricopeptide repeat protein [Thermoanaerobaculum sp.]|nr:tetratricopeptide repeat protein [Thermoanaerobaculum sp.]MDW7967913.1 tetratricopeptide repeat protein [Thermoanaerobaculum sp.]
MRWRVLLGVLVLLGVGCASQPGGGAAGEQLRQGVEAAVAGLWQEAAFRFERARALGGETPELLNNLAVAYEALGRYEEALATYKRALELAPNNSRIRRNYGRFAEFYASYIRGIRPRGGTHEGS